MSERLTEAANDNEAVTFGSGNVLKDLDILFTPEEWAEMCRKQGVSSPYPFATIVALDPSKALAPSP